MIFRNIAFVVLCLYASSSLAQSQPRDVASEAFYAQAKGDYERLSLYYDASVVSVFSKLAEQLIEASKSEPASKTTLEGMFGTSDPARITSLDERAVFAKMFSYIFTSRLSQKEQELMRGATFEYIDTSFTDSTHAEVRYVVAFTKDVKIGPKTMLLVSDGKAWRITLKPELLLAIEAAIAPLKP